jgi:hypothetical protein
MKVECYVVCVGDGGTQSVSLELTDPPHPYFDNSGLWKLKHGGLAQIRAGGKSSGIRCTAINFCMAIDI